MTGSGGRSTWIVIAGLLCACDGAPTASAPSAALADRAAPAPPVERPTLHGRVARPDGTPLAGAIVRAEPVPAFPGVPDERVAVEAAAAADGAFDLPGVDAGDWAVTCGADGAWRVPQGVVRLPDVRRFDVVLPPGPVFEGTLVDDATGKAFPGVKVQALRAGGIVAEAVTTADGRFTFDLHRPYAELDEYRLDAPGYTAHPGGFGMSCVVDQFSAGDHVPIALRARRGWTVRGTVTGPAGPVAGADVTAWYFVDAPGESGSGSASKDVTTDARGVYEVACLEHGDCVVRVSAPGLVQDAVRDAGVRDPRAWPDRAPDACRVELTDENRAAAVVRHDVKLVAATAMTRRRIHGRVHDAADAPIVGARICAGLAFEFAETKSAADGTFAVDAPVEADVARISTSRAGFMDESGSVDFSSQDADKPLDVELTPDPVLHGRVADTKGAAVAGARVVVVPHSYPVASGAGGDGPPFAPAAPVEAVCDADGRFSLTFHCADEGMAIVATAPGFAPQRTALSTDAPTPRMQVDVSLPALTPLTGRVVRSDSGAPAAGVCVAEAAYADVDESRADDVGRTGRILAVTATDGSFTIAGIGAGPRDLRAFGYGWRPRKFAVEIPLVTAVRVEIEPSLTLAGRLLFDDGSPAAGVEVRAFDHPREADGNWGEQAGRKVESRADGRFAINGLRPVRHWLIVRWGEPRIIEANLGPFAPDDGAERTIRVARGATIVGRLVDLQGRPFVVEEGADKPDVRATPASGADRPDGNGQVDADDETGAFDIGGLDHGAYDVTIRARGFVPLKLKNVRADAGPLVVKMDPGLSLSGVLLGANGRPLPNATLVATPEDPDAADGDAQRDCDTDERGAFRIAGLSQGRWRLDLYRGVTVDGSQRLSGNLEFDAGADDLRLKCVAVARKRR